MMREQLVSLGVDHWLLPAMLIWPIAAAVLVRLGGTDISRDDAGAGVPSGGPDARILTAIALGVEALLSVLLWAVFDPEQRGWQAVIDLQWLPDPGATLSLGVDGISLPLVVLTAFMVFLAFLGSWNNVRVRTPAFGGLVLLLTSGLVGVFVTLDLLAFYLSWELMLIPTYLLVGVWGAAGTTRAALRYVLFTFVGSLLMLLAIIALWSAGGAESLHIDSLLQIPLSSTAQFWMFLAFFTAFCVKSALVPFHTWLPDAQEAAPIIAAITIGLKVGGYGLLRFAIPLFPAAATNETLRTVILTLATIAVVYGSLVAFAQDDFKRVISYSSVSHFGLIVLAAFALTPQSVQGALIGIISSAIATTALFLLAGMLEDRRGTTRFADFGGIARVVPWFGAVLVISIFSTIALPGTVGFVSEFLMLLGTFATHPVPAVAATAGVILSAMYGLRAVQLLVFGSMENKSNNSLADFSGRERVVMATLVAAILYLGLAPGAVLNRANHASQSLVEVVRFGPNAPVTLPPVSVKR